MKIVSTRAGRAVKYWYLNKLGVANWLNYKSRLLRIQ